MKIVLVCIGRIKKDYIKSGIMEYLARIKRYTPIEAVEIKEESIRAGNSIQKALEKEARRVLEKIKEGDFIIALGDKGKQYTSGGLADFINTLSSRGKRRLCLIVGGAYGLHPSILEGADSVLALSSMTFPHELARLILLEQIYRAFTILNNEPYSH